MTQLELFNNEVIDDKPFVEEENFTSKSRLNLIDLFAGIGGFHYGVAASASKFNLGVNPLLVSEIEESCQETYSYNFKTEVRGDVNNIHLGDYNSIADIITAGFPCQPFSNSGKKLGLSDPRGQFYYRIEEIIKHFNTKSFILENVPGIKSSGGGRFHSKLSILPTQIGSTMNFIEENLIKLKDYNIKWIELDSSQFGSPQVRKRVYIIGLHKDYSKNIDLVFNRYADKPFVTISEKEVISGLELSKKQQENIRSFMINPPSYMNGMRRVGNAYLCKGGNIGQTYHAYGKVPTLTKVWSRFLPVYFPHKNESLPEINVKEFYPNDYYGKGYIRKVSVREAARLQGFPDSFIPHSNKNKAYEHLGNAVNAKVVREIADNILRYIL